MPADRWNLTPTYPESELERMNCRQAERVMPCIGHLLEAWEVLPLELRTDPELSDLMVEIEEIAHRMETS